MTLQSYSSTGPLISVLMTGGTTMLSALYQCSALFFGNYGPKVYFFTLQESDNYLLFLLQVVFISYNPPVPRRWVVWVDTDGWGWESRWGVVERNYSFPARQNIAESKGNVCVEENTTGVGDGEHRGAEHISNHSNRWRCLFSSCDALLMLTRSCPSLTAKLPVKDDTDGCSELKLLADFSLPLVYCFH